MPNKLCPPYLFNCLPPVASDVNNYNLRNNPNYVPHRCRLGTSASSFIPFIISLDMSIRNSAILTVFSHMVKDDTNTILEYYNEGPRKLNILHTGLDADL
jgi:hypothetical protein